MFDFKENTPFFSVKIGFAFEIWQISKVSARHPETRPEVKQWQFIANKSAFHRDDSQDYSENYTEYEPTKTIEMTQPQYEQGLVKHEPIKH